MESDINARLYKNHSWCKAPEAPAMHLCLSMVYGINVMKFAALLITAVILMFTNVTIKRTLKSKFYLYGI